MFLSGCASASRLTRLSSVPTAHADPGSAASTTFSITIRSSVSAWHAGHVGTDPLRTSVSNS